MNIKIVNFSQTKVAVLEHRAPLDRVYETVSKFIDWRKQSKLSPAKSSKTFAIIYDNPETTPANEFSFDICGSENTPIPENPQGIKTGEIPGAAAPYYATIETWIISELAFARCIRSSFQKVVKSYETIPAAFIT